MLREEERRKALGYQVRSQSPRFERLVDESIYLLGACDAQFADARCDYLESGCRLFDIRCRPLCRPPRKRCSPTTLDSAACHRKRLSTKFTIQVMIESPDALPLTVPIQTIERSCCHRPRTIKGYHPLRFRSALGCASFRVALASNRRTRAIAFRLEMVFSQLAPIHVQRPSIRRSR